MVKWILPGLLLLLMAACNTDPDIALSNKGVYISPNPAFEETTITLSVGSEATVEVVDCDGELVVKETVPDGGSLKVFIGTRSPGIFHVVVRSKKGTVTQQFMKL